MVSNNRRQRRPAYTDQDRENQLVSLAADLAEKQLVEGTASSQVITHYLKLGSSRERLEQERIANENKLIGAKIEAMAAAERIEELYGKALSAMRAYSGQDDTSDDEGFDEYYDEDLR